MGLPKKVPLVTVQKPRHIEWHLWAEYPRAGVVRLRSGLEKPSVWFAIIGTLCAIAGGIFTFTGAVIGPIAGMAAVLAGLMVVLWKWPNRLFFAKDVATFSREDIQIRTTHWKVTEGIDIYLRWYRNPSSEEDANGYCYVFRNRSTGRVAQLRLRSHRGMQWISDMLEGFGFAISDMLHGIPIEVAEEAEDGLGIPEPVHPPKPSV